MLLVAPITKPCRLLPFECHVAVRPRRAHCQALARVRPDSWAEALTQRGPSRDRTATGKILELSTSNSGLSRLGVSTGPAVEVRPFKLQRAGSHHDVHSTGSSLRLSVPCTSRYIMMQIKLSFCAIQKARHGMLGISTNFTELRDTMFPSITLLSLISIALTAVDAGPVGRRTTGNATLSLMTRTTFNEHGNRISMLIERRPGKVYFGESLSQTFADIDLARAQAQALQERDQVTGSLSVKNQNFRHTVDIGVGTPPISCTWIIHPHMCTYALAAERCKTRSLLIPQVPSPGWVLRVIKHMSRRAPVMTPANPSYVSCFF